MNKTKVTIREIGIAEYLTELTGERTPLSDFYVRTRSCRILGAFDETGQSVGFLLAEPRTVTEVLFLTSRREGFEIKKLLLDFLIGGMPSGSRLRWRIIAHPEDEKGALAYGFRQESTLLLFHSNRYDEDFEKNIFQRFSRLADSVSRRGYRTVPFSELTKEQKDQILKDPDREFAPELHPERLIKDRTGGISERLSTAALKDGKVAAYSLLRAPSRSRCIFEILCVAKSKRRSGAVILPVVQSIREMVSAGYDSLTFAVYDRNRDMLSLVERDFSSGIESRSVQHNMLFTSDSRDPKDVLKYKEKT